MITYYAICLVNDYGVMLYRGTSYIKAMDSIHRIIDNDWRKDCWWNYNHGDNVVRGWRSIGSVIRDLRIIKERS